MRYGQACFSCNRDGGQETIRDCEGASNIWLSHIAGSDPENNEKITIKSGRVGAMCEPSEESGINRLILHSSERSSLSEV